MKLRDGRIHLSPSDLANYLACRHLTQLDAAVQRGVRPAPPLYENVIRDLIARKGEEHEAAFLAALVADGRTVTTIDSEDRDFERAARETEAASAPPRRSCGSRPATATTSSCSSPPTRWLCGRAGVLAWCPRHDRQVAFFLQLMN